MGKLFDSDLPFGYLISKIPQIQISSGCETIPFSRDGDEQKHIYKRTTVHIHHIASSRIARVEGISTDY